MVRPLLLVGAGGFARETAEAVRAVNAVRPTWDLLGFLDDDPARHGVLFGGAPVLGPIEAVHHHPPAPVLLCTGRPGDYRTPARPVPAPRSSSARAGRTTTAAARAWPPGWRSTTSVTRPSCTRLPPSASPAASERDRCSSRTSTSPRTSSSAGTSRPCRRSS